VRSARFGQGVSRGGVTHVLVQLATLAGFSRPVDETLVQRLGQEVARRLEHMQPVDHETVGIVNIICCMKTMRMRVCGTT
jgi:hypothetical protein